MGGDKLPPLIVDIADRLREELVVPPLTIDGAIWNAMERLRAAEEDRSTAGDHDRGT